VPPDAEGRGAPAGLRRRVGVLGDSGGGTLARGAAKSALNFLSVEVVQKDRDRLAESEAQFENVDAILAAFS